MKLLALAIVLFVIGVGVLLGAVVALWLMLPGAP